MELTGAQVLMNVLKEEGVDTIFGFPGGAVIDISSLSAMSRVLSTPQTGTHGPPAGLASAW